MAFYTNFYLDRGKLHVRGYAMGLPFAKTVKVKPYLFVKSPKGGEYKTIRGEPCMRMDFDSMWDAREFTKKYEGMENFEIFGSQLHGYVAINDMFPGNVEFDPSLISIVTIDIEVESSDGFPDPKKADKLITSITLRKKGKSAIFSYGDYTPKDSSID
jgi:hypothetical protein